MRESLASLAKIHYGKSPNEVAFVDGTIPIVGTGGIYGQASRALFDKGIVVARKGSLGKPYLFQTPFWPVDTTYAVVPFEGVCIEWLYYCLLDFDLTKLNEATGVPSINRNWLAKITFHNPGSAQQKRVAEVITTIDIAIEQTEALIEKYQHIKAGLMHDLFTRGVLPSGQLRPPRDQAPELYQDTGIGWIPRGWAVAPLEAILHESGGYLQTGPFGSQLHAHEYQTEGIPVVMPQDIKEGKIGTDTIARISEKRVVSLAKHQLKIGDIIIARRGELSRAAAVSEREQGWLCGTGCFLLRLGRTDLNHFFFSHIYRYDYIQRQIAGTQVGTTMPSLNNSVLGRVQFPCPTPNEQCDISTRLSNADAETNTLKDHAAKLRLQKLGLMQDLLTGKVPVNEIEGVATDGRYQNPKTSLSPDPI